MLPAVREAKQDKTLVPGEKTAVEIIHVMEASTDLFGGQTVKILRTLTQIQQLAVLAFVVSARRSPRHNLICRDADRETACGCSRCCALGREASVSRCRIYTRRSRA